MKMPEVHEDIIHAVHSEFGIDHFHCNPKWLIETFNKIRVENPVVAMVIASITNNHGPDAGGACLFLYRIIESQIEADQLKELFNEDA